MLHSDLPIKPSFRATDNHKLLPHISAAFIKRIVIVPSLLAPTIYLQGNGTFEVHLDMREPNSFLEIEGPVEVMCSYQIWVDGSKHVVIRKARS